MPVVHVSSSGAADLLGDQFKRYPIWLQNFPNDPSTNPSTVVTKFYDKKGPYLPGSNPWTLWQVSSQSRLEGVEDNVDFDVFFGNAARNSKNSQNQERTLRSTSPLIQLIDRLKKRPEHALRRFAFAAQGERQQLNLAAPPLNCTQAVCRPRRFGPGRQGSQQTVDSDAKCNPVDSIGSSTKSRVSYSNAGHLLGFQRMRTARRRRNIEPLQ